MLRESRVKSIELIDGMLIPREILLSDERYENVKKYIPSLKEVYSSSYMTSLQKQLLLIKSGLLSTSFVKYLKR